MIWRLVELAILAWIVATWLRRQFLPTRSASRSGSPGPFCGFGVAPSPERPPGVPAATTLVRCATCGTHVPLAGSVVIGVDGRAFCSEACRPRPQG